MFPTHPIHSLAGSVPATNFVGTNDLERNDLLGRLTKHQTVISNSELSNSTCLMSLSSSLRKLPYRRISYNPNRPFGVKCALHVKRISSSTSAFETVGSVEFTRYLTSHQELGDSWDITTECPGLESRQYLEPGSSGYVVSISGIQEPVIAVAELAFDIGLKSWSSCLENSRLRPNIFSMIQETSERIGQGSSPAQLFLNLQFPICPYRWSDSQGEWLGRHSPEQHSAPQSWGAWIEGDDSVAKLFLPCFTLHAKALPNKKWLVLLLFPFGTLEEHEIDGSKFMTYAEETGLSLSNPFEITIALFDYLGSYWTDYYEDCLRTLQEHPGVMAAEPVPVSPIRCINRLQVQKQVVLACIRSLDTLTLAFSEVHDYFVSKQSVFYRGDRPTEPDEFYPRVRFERLTHQFNSLLPFIQGLIDAHLVQMQRTLAITQLEESQKAIQQADSVKNLTAVAFVFIPISSVAAIFGMNVQELTQPQPQIWVFAVTMGVVLTATLFFALLDKFKRLVRFTVLLKIYPYRNARHESGRVDLSLRHVWGSSKLWARQRKWDSEASKHIDVSRWLSLKDKLKKTRQIVQACWRDSREATQKRSL